MIFLYLQFYISWHCHVPPAWYSDFLPGFCPQSGRSVSISASNAAPLQVLSTPAAVVHFRTQHVHGPPSVLRLALASLQEGAPAHPPAAASSTRSFVAFSCSALPLVSFLLSLHFAAAFSYPPESVHQVQACLSLGPSWRLQAPVRSAPSRCHTPVPLMRLCRDSRGSPGRSKGQAAAGLGGSSP